MQMRYFLIAVILKLVLKPTYWCFILKFLDFIKLFAITVVLKNYRIQNLFLLNMYKIEQYESNVTQLQIKRNLHGILHSKK